MTPQFGHLWTAFCEPPDFAFGHSLLPGISRLRTLQEQLRTHLARQSDTLPTSEARVQTIPCAHQKSKNYISGRCKEKTGAAGFAPDPMIDGVSLRPDVIARIELLAINHQL